MSIHISLEDKIYDAKFSGSLDSAIPYPNYLLFLYFSSGVYQIWDILIDKFIDDGSIEKSLKYIRYYSKCEIAYYSLTKQELKIFNIFEKKEKKISAKVPTKQAIPDNERSEQSIKNLYDEGTAFLTLYLSGLLVVYEQRTNFNSNDNIITVFDETSNPFFYQTVYGNATQKNLNLSLINNIDTIALWSNSFYDQPLEFYVLNIQKKDAGFKVVSMHNMSISCQILHAMGWKSNEIVFLGNHNLGSPFIKIINYAEEKEIKYIEINQLVSPIKNFLMTEFFYGDLEKQILIFAAEGPKGPIICFVNTENGKMETKKHLEVDDAGMVQRVFSEFGNFYIEYEGEKNNNLKQINFRVCSIVAKKDWLLYVLEKKNIIQKSGKWVTQEILNFLD